MDGRIEFDNGSKIEIVESENVTRGKQSKGIEWFHWKEYENRMLPYAEQCVNGEITVDEYNRLCDEVKDQFIKDYTE